MTDNARPINREFADRLRALMNKKGVSASELAHKIWNDVQRDRGLMTKPIICIDFDGVLHSYKSGWQGALVIADDPVPGAMDFLKNALRVFDIHIHSTRSATLMGRAKMMGWTHDRLVERFGEGEGEQIADRLSFPRDKPPAFLTIDDRAITFTGVWPDPVELMSFKPWNKS